MVTFKEKFNQFCDKSEQKLEEAKQKRKEAKEKRKKWWEQHPNLEHFASKSLVIGSVVTLYGGLIALVIATSKDQMEHPEKYVHEKEETKTDFDILIDAADAIGLQKGEGCQIFVDKDGNTAIKRKYIIPCDGDDDNIPDEETNEDAVNISRF